MKQKKKDELTCQAVSGRLDIFNSGGFVDCGHGILADDSGFYMSLQTGSSANMQWSEPIFNNYTRMFQDKLFLRSVGNTFLYLIIQVPIMLILAILLAQLLNNKHLRLKGFFRTCIFLPCATSLVSYSLIF